MAANVANLANLGIGAVLLDSFEVMNTDTITKEYTISNFKNMIKGYSLVVFTFYKELTSYSARSYGDFTFSVDGLLDTLSTGWKINLLKGMTTTVSGGMDFNYYSGDIYRLTWTNNSGNADVIKGKIYGIK